MTEKQLPKDVAAAQIEALIEAKRQPYVVAVGTVCFEWNRLLESLGALFSQVSGMGRRQGMAVWYSQRADRSQMAMLRAAIKAKDEEDDWPKKHATCQQDLIWLATEAENLADARNTAVHAPVSLIVDQGGIKLVPHIILSNPLAERLLGASDLLKEFDWCSHWARSLRRFADEAESSLLWEQTAWPIKPARPPRPARDEL
jgi:hypothetical protein